MLQYNGMDQLELKQETDSRRQWRENARKANDDWF